MPNDTTKLIDALLRVQELVDAAEALLEDARLRNAHRTTDLAGTVQVGTDALHRVHKALRREPTA